MFRFIKMSDGWYGLEIPKNITDNEEATILEMENINTFVDEGNIVCFVEDLESFCEFVGIEENEVKMIKS